MAGKTWEVCSHLGENQTDRTRIVPKGEERDRLSSYMEPSGRDLWRSVLLCVCFPPGPDLNQANFIPKLEKKNLPIEEGSLVLTACPTNAAKYLGLNVDMKHLCISPRVATRP